jgi:pyruvate kinase
MLSGETTTGKYPVDAVKYMAEIVENTEKYLDYENIEKPVYDADITDTIATSVVDASNMLDVKAIVAATLSGYTAAKISNLRPKTIIVAACPSSEVALSLSLRFGVYSTLLPVYDSTDKLVKEAINKTKEIVKLKEKDLIVITGGFPNNGPVKTTNFLKIERI